MYIPAHPPKLCGGSYTLPSVDWCGFYFSDPIFLQNQDETEHWI